MQLTNVMIFVRLTVLCKLHDTIITIKMRSMSFIATMMFRLDWICDVTFNGMHVRCMVGIHKDTYKWRRNWCKV
jgi:hypothetical protein